MKNKIVNLIVSLGYRDYDVQEFYYSEYKQKEFKLGLVDSDGHYPIAISAEEEGYLLFIDLCNLANWGHQCCYYMLDDNANIIAQEEHIWWPKDFDKLIKLDMETLAPKHYNQTKFAIKKCTEKYSKALRRLSK